MATKSNYKKGNYKYFRVTATVGKDKNGKAIKKEFYGKSQKEALEKKEKYLTEIKKGLALDYDKQELGELMKIWLSEYVKVNSEKNTLARYMLVYKNYIKNTELNTKKISEIKFLYLQQYYNKLFKDGVASSKIFNLNKVLRNFFNFCINNSYLVSNPTFRIVIPAEKKVANDDNKIDIFTEEEVLKIAKNCKDYMYILFKLAVTTGLRQGELLGLQLNCIDFENLEITVKQALKNVTIYDEDFEKSHKKLELGTTKNKKTRTVPLSPAIVKDLQVHIYNQRKLFVEKGLIFDENDLLFTTKGCQPINARNLQRAWERTLKRADVRYRKFHNVRHTFASKLLEKGIDIKTISTLLGHSNISITADTYLHIVSETKTSAISVIDFKLG